MLESLTEIEALEITVFTTWAAKCFAEYRVKDPTNIPHRSDGAYDLEAPKHHPSQVSSSLLVGGLNSQS